MPIGAGERVTQAWRAFGELVPFAVAVALIAGLVVAVVHARRRWLGDGTADLARTASTAGVVVAVLAVAAVTILPRSWGGPESYNWIPLSSIWELATGSVDASVAVRNIAGNVVLFAPLGAALAWWAVLRGRSPLQHALRHGGVLSVTVEAVQLVLPLGRSVDVDDLLLNTLGTAFGAGGTLLLLRLRGRPATVAVDPVADEATAVRVP